MRLKNEIKCDVLVMGAGIAGIMAAISAAEAGADVCIVSGTRICSGSSFYPGTWGLGLVGPESEADEEDLKSVILKVGEGMADPELVSVLVSHIRRGTDRLKAFGIQLKEAENKGEKEFIPCFDYKNRDWHGIVKDSAREVFLAQLEELGVRCFPSTRILQFIMTDGRVSGAAALTEKGGLTAFSCKSLVVASGGLGGLFQYRLNTDDVTGCGQYLALRAGAKLINIEFMQMMPGYLSPAPKTIYNEKVFKYSNFCRQETGRSIFEDWRKADLEERMEVRSTHGPFTTRLPSAPVDIRLFTEFLRNPRGVTVTYRESLRENQPEFIRTYFEWLKEEKHLTIDDPIQLGIFAHASNGGIRIGPDGSTGVPGLYACGEATGGMHGADRLGGLSTANGLVFGEIAGKAAAGWSSSISGPEEEWAEVLLSVIPNAASYLKQIQEMNFECAMVIRNGARAELALNRLERIRELCRCEAGYLETGDDTAGLAVSCRLTAALHLSECLMKAILLRKESRGSHYRWDYPEKKENFSKRILSVWDDGVKTGWE